MTRDAAVPFVLIVALVSHVAHVMDNATSALVTSIQVQRRLKQTQFGKFFQKR